MRSDGITRVVHNPGHPLPEKRTPPETAQPTRLQARGWIEAPDGALLAIATDRCPLR